MGQTDELWRLQNVVIPELEGAIKNHHCSDAADQAELYNLMSQLSAAQTRVDKLRHRPPGTPLDVEKRRGVAGVGKMVTLDFGDGPEEYHFVAELPSANSISVESPVGQAIVGLRAGSAVTVTLPSGNDVDIKVLSVRTSR